MGGIMDKITLAHGEGGSMTHALIQEVIVKHFDNYYLRQNLDAACLEIKGKIAFTTDSFVVKPIFFKGGDIGKLAVSGTVNDLITVGAKPLFLSCSFIIEEGFDMNQLIRIVTSMSQTCKEANVMIATGDTKVVSKGEADGIYINTSGIGEIKHEINNEIEVGDKLIVSGALALHGTTILVDRYNLNVEMSVESDCAPLTYLLPIIKEYHQSIKWMRDPTRGGIATTLNELKDQIRCDIEVDELSIPFHKEVMAINQLLGIDPMYLSSEGRMVFVVSNENAEAFVCDLKQFDANAAMIGEIKRKNDDAKVLLKTSIGGLRILGTLDDLILPRIC